jgi:hypothetical protein
MLNLNETGSSDKGPMTSGKKGRCRNLKSRNIQREKQSKEAYSSTLRWMTGLLSLLVILSLHSPALAQQNPCAEIGPDCRLMTTAEVNALKERFLALKAALPVPDPARWAPPSGVDETYTMPFIAELNLGAILTCNSWPAGCFTEKNSVSFIYDSLVKREKAGGKKPTEPEKASKKPEDIQAAAAAAVLAIQEMQAEIGNRIEVDAKLLPHAYLVDNVNGKCVDVSDPEAVNIEKSATFLSWESGDETSLTMVFGPRTCKEAETLRVGKPAKVLAPVKSIVLEISGPNKAEVAALKKKINRQAFEALLGDVVK